MTAIEKTLRFTVLAGIFALPFIVFIVAQSLFFPYITGKNFAFRIIVEIIAGAGLALMLVSDAYRPRRSLLLAAFALFVAIIGLADAFGAYPFKSFWSNYERMEGWVTLAHLLLYILVASAFLTKESWMWFWRVIAGVSVVAGLHALLQLFGVTALGQGGAGGLGARLDATFGNPIYLAVFMLFSIFIAAMLFAADFRGRPKGSRTGVVVVWGFVIALDTIVLLFTGTRGATLGLIGAVLLTALLFIIFSRGDPSFDRIRTIATGVLVGILVLAGGFFLVRDASWVHKIGFLDRLATISLSENVLQARIMNIQMAWKGAKERPFLGWGQEHYALVFDKHYNPGMYAQEAWFDRVHNTPMDWLVAGGFLGLISYLLIFAAALWALWRASVFTFVDKSLLTGLLAGYFVQNLTVFDNITSYLLFASVIAYIAWADAESHAKPRLFSAKSLSRSGLPVVAAIAVVLVWGTAWGVNQKALAQNKLIIKAITPQQEGIGKNLEYFEQAISYGSYGTQEAREQLSQIALQVVSSSDAPAEAKRASYDAAVRELKAQAELSPLDARFPVFLGVLQNAAGDYEEAKKTLELARTLSPRKQSILFEQAKNAQARGDNAALVQLLKDAYELDTSFTTARLYYVSVLVRTGADAAADPILAPLIESGAAASPLIAAAYVSRGRFDKIISIWRKHIEANPENVMAHFTVAAALYEMGSAEEAIREVEEAVRKDPSLRAQADTFIAEIRAGT